MEPINATARKLHGLLDSAHDDVQAAEAALYDTPLWSADPDKDDIRDAAADLLDTLLDAATSLQALIGLLVGIAYPPADTPAAAIAKVIGISQNEKATA